MPPESPPPPLRLSGLAATERLAGWAAARARPGDALLLEGPLGAGKSAFARAFLRAAAGDPALEVPSPTFTLVQGYDLPAGFAAAHFDLYRIAVDAELTELGWDDARQGLVLVEWPERLGAARPAGPAVLTVSLAPGATPIERLVRLAGWPDRLDQSSIAAALR